MKKKIQQRIGMDNIDCNEMEENGTRIEGNAAGGGQIKDGGVDILDKSGHLRLTIGVFCARDQHRGVTFADELYRAENLEQILYPVASTGFYISNSISLFHSDVVGLTKLGH